MEQLDELDGNVHGRTTNINNFVPLFESYNEEVTKLRTKPNKTLIEVLSEDEDNDKTKENRTRIIQNTKTTKKKEKIVNTNKPESDYKLNGDSGIAELY